MIQCRIHYIVPGAIACSMLSLASCQGGASQRGPTFPAANETTSRALPRRP